MCATPPVYRGRDPDEIRRAIEDPYRREDQFAVRFARYLNRVRFGGDASPSTTREYIDALEEEIRLLRAEVSRLADDAD